MPSMVTPGVRHAFKGHTRALHQKSKVPGEQRAVPQEHQSARMASKKTLSVAAMGSTSSLDPVKKNAKGGVFVSEEVSSAPPAVP